MAHEDDKLDKLLNDMKDHLKKKNVAATIHKSNDLAISSFTPYTISTGLAELDLQLGGRGGLPAGRLIEYYGFEMCGKTTAALHAIAEVQKMGGFAMFIDAEHTFSPIRAEQCGVNLERLQIMSAQSIEAIFEAACTYVEYIEGLGLAHKYPVLIVVDSVTGTHIESEMKEKKKEAYAKDIRVGGEAKAIRRGVKRLHGILARSKVSCILINHAIATNLTATFGKKSGAAGGHGTKIMASVRVEFKNFGKISKKVKEAQDLREGQMVTLTIEKLKNANLKLPKVEKVELREYGFNQNLSLLNASVMTSWITQQGTGVSQYYEMPVGEETRQFKKREWDDVVEGLGGYEKVYAIWLDRARQSGHIQLWEEAW